MAPSVGDEKKISYDPSVRKPSTGGDRAAPNIQPKPASPQRQGFPGVRRVENRDGRYVAGRVGPLEPSRDDLWMPAGTQNV